MPRSVVSEAKINGRNRQKRNGRREHYVSDQYQTITPQDGEVGMLEGSPVRTGGLVKQLMIGEITTKKDDGNAKTSQHRPLVRRLPTTLDKDQPRDQQNCCERIEPSIHVGQNF